MQAFNHTQPLSVRAVSVRGLAVALRAGVSAGALGMLGLGMTAQAQTAPAAPASTTAPAADSGTIVVSGIRASLANAQSKKRASDTVVDVLTAQDIGALPDRSVTEALQRVPGVAINRFAGSNDPDHFSVEGSGVVIRGLNFVRSEFNGRDAFAAGVGGQALNFADVPSELLGSVEVYKNSTADMIEGGLAGTVNLNTRKPFDNHDTRYHVGFDAEANYGDMAKKWSPTGSLLVSKNWETGIGRIGLLADVSYSQVLSRADGIQVTNFQTRDGTVVAGADGAGPVCRNPLPSNTDTTTLPPAGSPCGTASTPGADGNADLLPIAYAPLGGQFRTQNFDRQRDGIALAAQFETLDHAALFTAQFLRSHTSNAWNEHTFETAPDLSEYNTYPAGCQQNTGSPQGQPTAVCPVGSFQNYTYASNGLFESGYITAPGTGYRSAESGSGAGNFTPSGGIQQSLSDRQVYETNTNTDYGLNAELHPTDRLLVNLDFDYTESHHTNLDVSILGSTFADEQLNLTGALPVVTPTKPLTLAASWAGASPLANETNAQYFADPRVQFWRAAMDHIEDSTGHEAAARADLVWKFEGDGFLQKIKFGARYADRAQTVRYTTYNWGALSEVWSGSGPVSIAEQGASQASLYTVNNFFRGEIPGPPTAFYYNGDLINNYAGSSAFFQSIEHTWQTTNGAGASGWVPLAQRAGVVAGTPFLPSEIQPIDQTDTDAYLMGVFRAGSAISGNFGVRYVHTDLVSVGSLGAPTASQAGTQDPFSVRCAPQTDPHTGQPIAATGICALGETYYDSLRAFANGQTTQNVARNHYTYWLPSFNVKYNPASNVILRFAASEVLTRPDSAYVRNFINSSYDVQTNVLSSQSGNPYLKPATAWQFDLTAEWYFSRVGSLTVNGFYKDVHNFFYQAVTAIPVTSNGITEEVYNRGPANYDGSGKVKGVELAYQQTFDFLPGFMKGLGFNGNYTYISSKGLPNSFLNGGNLANVSTVTPSGNLPLEGLSKHNVNATVFYERGPISLRVAYNWRSRFLLTASDVIFPYYSIFNDATGQMDASAFINLTKQIKIGVQGVNLLNEVTKTSQAYTGDPNVLAPRSYFMNDRRYSFILRGMF